MPPVFGLLHPIIREALVDLGISEPTPPQEMAIGPILRGENILLIAQAASGKTEAALLPVFDHLLRGERERGVRALYITPLRALNRDLMRRLIFWRDRLGIEIQVRHGDTEPWERLRQSKRPPEMLITTPETLQALLPSREMRRYLSPVGWVIVDEIHEIASSKRGSQLSVGLERLESLTGRPFQRIGLSATVGNPEEVASLLGGTHAVSIIAVELVKPFEYRIEYPTPEDLDFELAGELGTTPEATSRLRRVRTLVEGHGSTLIFAQGRGQVELLGNRLSRILPSIDVHHGSLSREERHMIEDQLKMGITRGIVCTSTLQLGIDIGAIDLCVQYLSPRRISTLIQRVGRSGHRLERRSKGVIISAYGEDALESAVIVGRAERGEVERLDIPMKPLDVLAHQLTGLTMDTGGMGRDEAYGIITRAYPYRGLERDELEEVSRFITSIGLIADEGGTMKPTERGRRYYYMNLSMIRDERRYPFVDLATDRVIGTVGDEFWTLRARVGLNVILRGRVWKIVHMDDERGVLYVLPSDDPLGALPGWDGELIPVPGEVAAEVGEMRERIASEIIRSGSAEKAVESLSSSLRVDVEALRAMVREVEEQLSQGFPIPSGRRVILEGYDRYLIVHSSLGERVNRTLGCIFDAILSEHDMIYSWWNDAYRILIEAPRRLSGEDLERMEDWLLHISGEEAERRLLEFMEARFPFGYMMRFVAERFGAIPRGRTLSPRELEGLQRRFRDTPIYRETLREAYREKLDLEGAKRLLSSIRSGETAVVRVMRGRPSPLAMHILEKYAETPELMASRLSADDQLDHMKRSIGSRRINLACMECGNWSRSIRVRELPEAPACEACGSRLLAVLRRDQRPEDFLSMLGRWMRGETLERGEMEAISHGRKTAVLVLSYGKRAIIALTVQGVGPSTAFGILSRMHRDEREFYRDLLMAKMQYIRTRPYWDENRIGR
jgi:ATP-dependent Lhr-like helicase